MIIDVVKVFGPLTLAFAVGIAITPILSHYLYHYRLWKKVAGKVDPSGQETKIFNELHREREVGTPRLGGIIIWVSTLLTAGLLWLWAWTFPSDLSEKLNFISRNQTWIPLATLLVGSLVGLADDWLEVTGRGQYRAGGMPFKQRLTIVLALGLLLASWFYFKLDYREIFIPFVGELFLGWWFIPLFLLVIAGLFSSGVIDGLDGLAGGIMAIIFATYAGVAFSQQQIDLAAFSAVVTGGILAFLWFNIPPARFYMSETGILGLTLTLTVVAFMTDAVAILPLIALPLVATSLSVAIQLASKKLRGGKKVFRVAPLHHHFEAIGWPSYKVVMRYWIIGVVAAIAGLILNLIGK
jgi:phospho-N-acetylmuramoyl-pentapeptide-transferase